MKLTKSYLRHLIREEIQKEGFLDMLKSRDHDQEGSGGSYRVEIVNTRDTSGSWRQVDVEAHSDEEAIEKAKGALGRKEKIRSITNPDGEPVV